MADPTETPPKQPPKTGEDKPSVNDVIRGIPPTPKRGERVRISEVHAAMTRLQTTPKGVGNSES